MLTNLEKLENIIEERWENYILKELYFLLKFKNTEKVFVNYKWEKIYLWTIKYNGNLIFSIYNINPDFKLRKGEKIHNLWYTIIKKLISQKILWSFLKRMKIKLFNKWKIYIIWILDEAQWFWEKTAKKLKIEWVIKDYKKIENEKMVFYI